MESKICSRCKIQKVLKIFTKNIQNVKFGIIVEV